MPKATEISYWPTRNGGYFCNYKRKKHQLALGPKDAPTGPTYKAALTAFAALLDEKPKPAIAVELSIREVLETYLSRIEKTKKAGTYAACSMACNVDRDTTFSSFSPTQRCSFFSVHPRPSTGDVRLTSPDGFDDLLDDLGRKKGRCRPCDSRSARPDLARYICGSNP